MIKVLITQLGTDFDIITEDGGYAFYWDEGEPKMQVYQGRITKKMTNKNYFSVAMQCLDNSDKSFMFDYTLVQPFIKAVYDAVNWLHPENKGFQCMMYQVEDLKERNKRVNEFLKFK